MALKIWNFGKRGGKKALGLTMAFFGFLLGVIGVSCKDYIAMYMPGPVSAYSLKGKVVDSITGDPVQGIRVTLNDSSGPLEGQSDVTGSAGLFLISSGKDMVFEFTYSLVDEDPEQYGSYKSKTVTVNFDSDPNPDDDFHESEQEIRVEPGTDE